jgi:hypothetical protein
MLFLHKNRFMLIARQCTTRLELWCQKLKVVPWECKILMLLKKQKPLQGRGVFA